MREGNKVFVKYQAQGGGQPQPEPQPLAYVLGTWWQYATHK